MCCSCDVEMLKLSPHGDDLDRKKCKWGYSSTYGRVWQSLESGSWFCVGLFGRNLASVAMKMFSHSIYFIKTLYKSCTFNAICKENAAINHVIVLHKNVNSCKLLVGHTMLLLIIICNFIFSKFQRGVLYGRSIYTKLELCHSSSSRYCFCAPHVKFTHILLQYHYYWIGDFLMDLILRRFCNICNTGEPE
jgi:hypothetical protein